VDYKLFPAYAMLSRWSAKGYKACLLCAQSTHSYKFHAKICYLGHQRWLPHNHPYHCQSQLFDIVEKFRTPLIRESRTEISR